MTAKIVKSSELEKKRSLEDEVKTSQTSHSIDFISEGGVLDRKTIDARHKAEKILEDADTKAKEIREKAKKVLAEVESVREKARQEGFTVGQSEGFSQVTEKLVSLEAMKEKFYQEAESEIIKLVVAIAEKVIGKVVEEQPEVIRDVIRQALERSIGDRITVRVNPEDYKTIASNDFAFRDVLDRTKRLHFKEDETVAKGGCIVETEVGTIDAQIETQLDAIKKALEI